MSMTRIVPAFLLVLVIGAAATAAQEASPAAAGQAASAMLNLNTATIAQLEALPGIGRATADRIIEYRETSGGFKKIEDLMNVRGIGEKNFLRLKPLITVSPAAAPARPDRTAQK
jgi:competence protein ComEA